MWRLLVTLVLAYVAHSTLALKCLTPEDDRLTKNPTSRRELLRSQLDFSLSLLKAVGKQEPSDNVFVSPLSIYNALLQAYFVSAGHTEASLHDTLFLPKNVDKVDMLLSYRLQRILTSTKEYTSQVHTANKLFLSREQTVQDCAEYYFNDEIEKLDFSANGILHSVDVINDWVSNITQNNIKELISAQNLNPSTQLILVNAAYFKGIWKNQFQPQFTRSGKFQISKDKSASVLMMFQQGTFGYWRSDDLKAEILEMPYKNGDISMIILLPDSTDASQTAAAAVLLQRLNRNTLLNIIRELGDPKNEEKLEIKLPKFTVERTIELTPCPKPQGYWAKTCTKGPGFKIVNEDKINPLRSVSIYEKRPLSSPVQYHRTKPFSHSARIITLLHRAVSSPVQHSWTKPKRLNARISSATGHMHTADFVCTILEGLGVGDLFKSTSNLTGLTGGPRIQLNSAVHKAKIQVDEKGTEAAAATALLDTRIPGEGFICDRPFLYLLYDKKQETLLFAGLYNDPTK